MDFDQLFLELFFFDILNMEFDVEQIFQVVVLDISQLDVVIVVIGSGRVEYVEVFFFGSEVIDVVLFDDDVEVFLLIDDLFDVVFFLESVVDVIFVEEDFVSFILSVYVIGNCY